MRSDPATDAEFIAVSLEQLAGLASEQRWGPLQFLIESALVEARRIRDGTAGGTIQGAPVPLLPPDRRRR
ncbi:hypothetical protein [Phreatobacter sp.]|uniref:hypothetical protein n=1 Tax=Phreatobacter sp. TaxID=1966341 RepID=UPI003F6E7DEB